MKNLLLLFSILPLVASPQWLESEVVLTLDSVSNIKGGIKQKTGYLENIDLTMSVDTQKADLWNSGTLFIYFLNDTGDDPSSFVGDTQGSNNIESYDTFKLYEAWYEHTIDEISILFGLHNYNSEFYVLDSAGLLLGSSFGIGPEVSQVNPSISPTTSLAFRVLWQNNDGIFIRSAIYDGVPGDPDDKNGTHIILRQEDGLFYSIESGKKSDNFKIAAGVWYHTAEVIDFKGDTCDANGGYYAIGEFFVGGNNSLFFQAGHAMSDKNAIDNYLGLGWHTSKLFSKSDEVGFGLARAMSSDINIKKNNLEDAETAYELTYAYKFNDILTMQSSFQYIQNPSMSKSIEDAVVLSIRSTINF